MIGVITAFYTFHQAAVLSDFTHDITTPLLPSCRRHRQDSTREALKGHDVLQIARFLSLFFHRHSSTLQCTQQALAADSPVLLELVCANPHATLLERSGPANDF